MSKLNFENLTIEELFNVDDLFEDAAEYAATLDAVDSPVTYIESAELAEVEKVRIRAYSKEYYKWLEQGKRPAVSKATAIVEELKGKSCKACDATGLYRIHKYNKDIPCAKCAGKGRVTSIDEARGRAYAARKAAGKPMSVSHTDYLH